MAHSTECIHFGAGVDCWSCDNDLAPAPRFRVRLTCCGRDAGHFGPCSWADADKFREGYLSGPGVKDASIPGSSGHERSAIIVDGVKP